jgi:ectoine hydroxylase-related dioxygenase (phytanoyl-CoA dioxygenase family)
MRPSPGLRRQTPDWAAPRRASPTSSIAVHARTLRPGAAAQELHADVPRASDAWPMLGLILMVDRFHAGNGATRFVPGSHRWTELPEDVLADRFASHPGEVLACGPAGSMILFDASTWHGHTIAWPDCRCRKMRARPPPHGGVFTR